MILDFIFIFILLNITFSGYRKGFAHMAISFLAFGISIIFVFLLFDYAGDALLKNEYSMELKTTISESIDKQFKEYEDDAIENVPYIASISKMTTNGDKIITFSKLSDAIAENTVKSLLSLPVILLSFVIIKLIIFAIKRLSRVVTSIPIIHGTDCLLGAMCGLLVGIFTIGITFLLLSFLQFLPGMSLIREQFNTSAIVIIINDFIF